MELRSCPEFNPSADVGASLATRWKLWSQDFDTFLLASGITDKKRQKALLLYQAGPRIREIFSQLEDTGGDEDFDLAKQKLTQYFEPQKNKRYEIYRFRESKQGGNETLDCFHTRLKNMAKPCEFADETFEIEEQIIIGGRSSRIRKKALRDPAYSLKDMLIDGRRDETSSYQAKEIESKEEIAETAHRFDTKTNNRSQKQCGNCGGKFPHKGSCPAKGKTCRNCNISNHFAVVCRSSKPSKPQKARNPNVNKSTAVRPFQHESDSDNDYMYAIQNSTSNKPKQSPRVNVTVAGHQFSILVDTGSTINVIDKKTFDKMKGLALQKTKVKAYPYNTVKPVEFLGKFESLVKTKSRFAVATFFVLQQENSGCLLSATTAQEMGIITLKLNKISTEAPENVTSSDPRINAIVQKYKEVFTWKIEKLCSKIKY